MEGFQENPKALIMKVYPKKERVMIKSLLIVVVSYLFFDTLLEFYKLYKTVRAEDEE